MNLSQDEANVNASPGGGPASGLPPAQPAPQPPHWGPPHSGQWWPDTRNRWERVHDPRHKSVALATVLSFFMPGVGQIYVGTYARGFVHFLVFGGIITILSMGPGPLTPLFGIGLAFFWFYNVIDAGRRATQYNLLIDAQANGVLPPDIKLPGARGSMAGGVALVVLGLLLLMYTRFDFDMYWVEEWWPAGLIAVGVWLFLKDRMGRGGDAAKGAE